MEISQLNMWIPTTVKRQLKMEAATRDIPIRDLVVEIFNHYFKNK